MTNTATSKNGVTIRLTDERWRHISSGHPEIAPWFFEVLETVDDPEIIYQGNSGELLAVKKLPDGTERWLVVAYKELMDGMGVFIDGFILTAFSTSKIKNFQKRTIAWQP